MTYEEALDFMGLQEGATQAEVKTAYREMSQILHPDRFNSNEKLQARATEQFKKLNEARDILTSGKGQGSARRSGQGSSTGSSVPRYSSEEAQLNARIMGIQAARTAMVAARDAEEESRKIGVIMAVVGLLGVIIGHRIPVADAVGGALAIWGIVKSINAIMTIKALDVKLAELKKQKKECVEELERLENEDG